MANVQFFIIVAVVAAFVSASEFQRFFIERQQKFADFEAYSHGIAETLKNLSVKTAKDRFEFSIMSYEFVGKLYVSIFYLNKAVNNIKDETFRSKLDTVITKLSIMANDFQQVQRSNDLVKVKSKMVSAIEVILDACVNVIDIIKEFQDKIPPVVYNPFKIGMQRAVFAIHQLKCGMDYFEKSADEIVKDIKHTFGNFLKVLKEISTDDDEVRKELLFQIVQFEHVVDASVLKLESWLELNNNDSEKIKTVKEVSAEMTEVRERLHRLALNYHTVVYIASHFGPIFRDYSMLVRTLGQLDIGGDPGTQEYVRPTLVHGIAITSLFTSELSLLLKNNTTVSLKH